MNTKNRVRIPRLSSKKAANVFIICPSDILGKKRYWEVAVKTDPRLAYIDAYIIDYYDVIATFTGDNGYKDAVEFAKKVSKKKSIAEV